MWTYWQSGCQRNVKEYFFEITQNAIQISRENSEVGMLLSVDG